MKTFVTDRKRALCTSAAHPPTPPPPPPPILMRLDLPKPASLAQKICHFNSLNRFIGWNITFIRMFFKHIPRKKFQSL